MGIEAENDWRNVGRPQLTMHRIATFSSEALFLCNNVGVSSQNISVRCEMRQLGTEPTDFHIVIRFGDLHICSQLIPINSVPCMYQGTYG